MPPTITITVKLFAAYQEAYGVSELILDFPPETSVRSVLDYIIAEHPQLTKWGDVTRLGINLKFADAETILQQGDEVVLIPPVSGG
ncbi:MAG: hypothetical protein N5P05_002898 [Chroococcopsis gigantea SAG 12.99]|jgi:molybdopterin synthase sulfur carrier subunit|nr:MoaD/ThiS family protein [Chlorogloea purpurea SAG 13.99]MDV3001292.1 hypothetical protein [Chroococcopsis gigantea SAG 12.99]